MKSKFHVPFETAQLLKEKGYDSLCDCYYEPDKELYLGILVSNIDYEDCGNCSAPTYHEVVDWLEEKGIYICIEVLLEKRGEFVFSSYIDWIGNINQETHVGTYPTREEALNAGILKALEII